MLGVPPCLGCASEVRPDARPTLSPGGAVCRRSRWRGLPASYRSWAGASVAGAASSTSYAASQTLHLSVPAGSRPAARPRRLLRRARACSSTRNMYQGLVQYKPGTASARARPLAGHQLDDLPEQADLHVPAAPGRDLPRRHAFHLGRHRAELRPAGGGQRRPGLHGRPTSASVPTPGPLHGRDHPEDSRTPPSSTTWPRPTARPWRARRHWPPTPGSDNDQTYLQTHDIGTGPYTLDRGQGRRDVPAEGLPAVLGPQALLHDDQHARDRQPLDRGDRVQRRPARRASCTT